MSLINDALRDIEARKESSSWTEADAKQYPDSHQPTIRWSKYSLAILFFASVITGVVLMGGQSRLDSLDSSIDSAKHVRGEVSGTKSKFEHTKKEVVKRSAGGESMPSVLVDHSVSLGGAEHASSLMFEDGRLNSVEDEKTLTSNEITNIPPATVLLMALADEALADQRLLLPENRNAYSYFQQVLSIAPEHKGARVGIESIKLRYLGLIKSAYDSGREESALQLTVRLLSISNNVERSKFEHDIAAMKAVYSLNANVGNGESIVLTNPSKDSGQSDTNTESVLGGKTKNNHESESDNKVSSVIVFSDEQKANSSLQHYHRLMQENDVDQALSVLEKSLGDMPDSEPIIAELLSHYLRFKKLSSMERLLNARESKEEQWVMQRAQLLQALEGDGAALSYFERTSKNYSLQENALAMQAALLNKGKQYALAMHNYELLLRESPKRAHYWLGLAVAQDGMLASRDAYLSYKEAYLIGGFNTDVVAFIKARLISLEKYAKTESEQSPNYPNKQTAGSMELTQW